MYNSLPLVELLQVLALKNNFQYKLSPVLPESSLLGHFVKMK
jgi:hypothetical protein